MENKAISAFNYVEVEIEVQAELGNNLKCEDGLQMKTTQKRKRPTKLKTT